MELKLELFFENNDEIGYLRSVLLTKYLNNLTEINRLCLDDEFESKKKILNIRSKTLFKIIKQIEGVTKGAINVKKS